MDWDDLRYFLAIARHGTLSGAARQLGVSQPTVGRRLEALETRLGTRLFQRTPTGYVPTEAGTGLVAGAERMETEALAAERAATGLDVGLEGAVRATSPEWVGQWLLGPHLAHFHDAHPGITVELVTDARLYSLTRREADVAFRFHRFDQNEIAQRRVATVGFGLYAAPAYLARHGTPDFTRGAPGHSLILMNESFGGLGDLPWLLALAHDARHALRTNSRDLQAVACAGGAGLAALPHVMAQARGLVAVDTPTPAPPREIWAGVHRDAQRTPRIRAFLDHMAQAMAR
ncbi:LysR family transcriptional regulator [Nitrospirillum amazonense]|uniref:LysR family transcriptional regulator n=1 Tax=Nitrospirillum amazonense TaxID=28077 RepID=A0A560F1H4_9PROT|nr:LysR family transcriptional regulator [Nitrospirillum amazonense]TWB15345.1 LysR family transcriptional regulator [Nitrospirillum amazonense]